MRFYLLGTECLIEIERERIENFLFQRERKKEERERENVVLFSNDPRNGHPLRLGVQLAGYGQQLFKGRRQVAIDDNIVEKVAVVKFDPLAAAGHFGELVVGESARGILVESRTGVGRRTGFTQHGETGRFDVNNMRLELGRPQRF